MGGLRREHKNLVRPRFFSFVSKDAKVCEDPINYLYLKVKNVNREESLNILKKSRKLCI